MELGKRIRELRKEKGLNQTQLAKEIGASQRAIDYWEKDINEPKASFIVSLANFFGVTSDYLLGLKTEDGRKIVDLTENKPEGEELLTFPAAAQSKGNKIRGGVMLKLTREQLDEIYRQNGIDPNKE